MATLNRGCGDSVPVGRSVPAEARAIAPAIAPSPLICKETDRYYSERVRFFPRELITAEDLILEQEYFRNKLRRHNRLLHGWGIVCGAQVCPGGTNEVIIKPGYILGPYGDEIYISEELRLNVCDERFDCSVAPDPCAEVRRKECAEGELLYVAVRYVECFSRPVRVHTAGCGCDEAACEYSRIRDHYEIKALTKRPHRPCLPEERMVNYCDKSCPDCPDQPWVVLAVVHRQHEGYRIDDDKTWAYRRYVYSLAERYYCCDHQTRELVRVDSGTAQPAPGDEEGQATPALVSLLDVEGRSVTARMFFTVQPGDTFSTLLDRSGDQKFVDPINGDTYSLREIYALANIDPHTKIHNVNEAVAPLEALRLRVADLRAARARLEDLLDNRGMKRLEEGHAGFPGAASSLRAVDLQGIAQDSPVGKKLASKTVAEVAAVRRESFVEEMSKGIRSKSQRTRVAREAGDIWDRAARATELSKAWQKQ